MDSSWVEPKSDYKAVYPYNNITQTNSGHFMEMDDSPGAERVRIQHRTGTFTEIQADGKRINKVVGDNYEIIMQNNNVLIKGQCNITVEGACVINVKGDAFTVVEGNMTSQVKGDSKQSVGGKAEVSVSGDLDVNSNGTITMQAKQVNVNGDLNVRGDINGTQNISATGNLTAQEGQVFGALGIWTPGYISGGFPGPTVAPGVWGILVGDAIRTIEADRLIFDSHIHGGVKGGGDLSSPPLTPE